MNYAIKQNLAAHISVTCELGEFSCIYLSEHKEPEAYLDSNMRKNVWRDLPPTVQAAVRAMFADVFALPLIERGAFIKTMRTLHMEAV